MTYLETIEYLYSQLPVFQKIGKKALKPKLTNISELLQALGNPQNDFKSIHIAGTNGKGSSSHFLASVLIESGYKVGLYTSPHLKDFRERFRINGQMVEEAFVVDFVENHKELIKKINPSFFELSVALAFKLFSQEKVDVAVIEVGLGGRYDSTNIISNVLLSLITNISNTKTS
jgi:dihydrofolate synthase/folylpolyglutamate synthase